MKKKIQKYLLNFILYLTLIVSITSCKKDNRNGDQIIADDVKAKKALADLLAYKNSDHLLSVGYLVNDGADPADATNVFNIPDSLDIVTLFAGYQKNPPSWRAAQAKGTKVLIAEYPSAAYFDHSTKDPYTKLPGYVRPAGIDSLKPTSTSTYEHYAKSKYYEYITLRGFDGIDMDVETGFFGGELPTEYAPNYMRAMVKYFGPKCTECVIRADKKRPIFVYDTDVLDKNSGGIGTEELYKPFKENFDHVYFQSYTTGNRAWYGSGTDDFLPIVNAYGAKFIALVNGDNYTDPKVSQDLLSYARWMKGNNGGGVGAYRMSRNYNATPRFANIRQAIQIMNPAKK
ncbi:MAG: hypothetical protein J7577_12225 [Sphingobacteriaceae bacterium]|nr:hypothetical protein [Sphingobacteriaceae bacterium]